MLRILLVLTIIAASEAVDAQEHSSDEPRGHSELAPDVREEPSKLKFQRSDFVAVPIPISNPTLGSGLVLGAGYFWPQTQAQKDVQPASVTAAAAMYTDNDSYAFALAQSNYWNEDRWRLDAILGYGRFRLELRLPQEIAADSRIRWDLEGTFFRAGLLRQIRGDWYAGATARVLNIEQTFDIEFELPDPEQGPLLSTSTQVVALGAKAIYDSRDAPINSYTGRYFEVTALRNGKTLGSDLGYWAYGAKFRSYHRLRPDLVLAWELRGCDRTSGAPLWDACRIGLRGFPQTEYLGTSSISGQAEARWQFHHEFGTVLFAGSGYVADSFSDSLSSEHVPSYGIGLRYLVLEKHRINLRLDYGRSRGSDAVYLSVTEAF